VADEHQPTLNYGKTSLGETPRALLILTNKTAIATKFDIVVEHFSAARTPTPPTGKLSIIMERLSKSKLRSLIDFIDIDLGNINFIMIHLYIMSFQDIFGFFLSVISFFFFCICFRRFR
jgi:hypothetical protein